MTYLYHYTNKSGLLAISKSGFIKKSSSVNGDAVFGDGVYLTAIGPKSSTHKILINNWDDSKAILIDPDAIARTDFCIAIPKAKIPEAKKMADTDRDVWLYSNSDLKLAGKSVVVYERN